MTTKNKGYAFTVSAIPEPDFIKEIKTTDDDPFAVSLELQGFYLFIERCKETPTKQACLNAIAEMEHDPTVLPPATVQQALNRY